MLSLDALVPLVPLEVPLVALALSGPRSTCMLAFGAWLGVLLEGKSEMLLLLVLALGAGVWEGCTSKGAEEGGAGGSVGGRAQSHITGGTMELHTRGLPARHVDCGCTAAQYAS